MSRYVVFVEENERYMDASARRERGRYETYEEAEAACRRLVDMSLEEHVRPGITADELFERYARWGDDPFIVGPADDPRRFSAWDYARARCRALGDVPATSASRGMVSFDAEGVVHTRADGRQERIRWDELEEVSIVTTDEGPFVDDVFWVLAGASGGCLVPSETEGVDALLARLQRLPGFDNEAVIAAMGSTGRARFVCWHALGAAP
ncbi:MAG TPA: hypothetical protein VD962_09330 [Rubricoccaceae bacterium]|nr:hypothetical protein [Rubricoccaceae bacterium]